LGFDPPWLLKYRKILIEEAADSIKRYTDVKVPSIQVEILSRKAAADFDEYYEQICTNDRLEEAKNLPLVILTTDSKGIVVRKADLREATRQKAEQSNNKLNKRLSKFDTKNRKRMATGAKVYQIEKFVRTPESVSFDFDSETQFDPTIKPRPQAKRVWASLELKGQLKGPGSNCFLNMVIKGVSTLFYLKSFLLTNGYYSHS